MTVSKAQWRWIVLGAVMVGSTIADGLVNTPGVFLLAWKDYFDCSMADVSIIAAANIFSYQLACLFGGGYYLNNLGYRKVVVAGGIGMFCGIICASFANSRLIILLTYGVLAGVAAGTTFPAFNVAIAAYFTKNFSTIRGISCSGIAAGMIFLPPVFQFLVDKFDWSGSLLIYSGIIGNVVVSGLILRPESAWKKNNSKREKNTIVLTKRQQYHARHNGCQAVDSPLKEPTALDEGVCKLKPNSSYVSSNSCSENCYSSSTHNNDVCNTINLEPSQSATVNGDCTASYSMLGSEEAGQETPEDINDDVIRAITIGLANRSPGCLRVFKGGNYFLFTLSFSTQLLIFSQFVFGVCYNVMLGHLIPMTVYRGIEAQTASFLMSFLGAGSLVARIFNGFIIDHGYMSASKLYLLSMFICGGGAMLVRLVNTFWLYGVSCVLIGAGSGGIMSIQVVLAKLYAGRLYMGRALGFAAFSAGVGGLVGPALGGVIFDITQNYDCVFYLSGGVLAASSLLYLLEPRIQRIDRKRAESFIRKTLDKETSV